MPGEPINLDDFEPLARAALENGPYGYFAGGAADERSLRANVEGWTRHRLRPRMLVDVSAVSTATAVLGHEIAAPVLVAPVALQRMAHADGEPGMARAAAAAGTIFTLSTIATSTPEEVAQAAPDGQRWFQVYVMTDRGVTQALIDQAVEHGFSALVLTVDAPRAGRRERDVRLGFSVPPGLDLPAVTAATGHTTGITVQEFFALLDPSLAWADLARLVDDSPVPVLVKGVLTAEDTRMAIEHGAAGVVVSNHGGRQLDGVGATADVLEEVVQEAGDDLEVLVDGGIRRGTDVLAALALGARAVCVGRPTLWGLAAGGQTGAQRVLELLADETRLALTLAGCPSPAHVTRAHVA